MTSVALTAAMTQWQAIRVGLARRAFGVNYPAVGGWVGGWEGGRVDGKVKETEGIGRETQGTASDIFWRRSSQMDFTSCLL